MARAARTRLALLAGALAVAGAQASPQAQMAIGISAAVKNDVRLRRPGGPVALPVRLRQRIALADQVQTGARSQLQLLLLDKSVFTVGANARLTIDRYVFDPNRSTRSLGATVTKGAFRFMSGRASNGGGGSQIRTPVASIGIRGTIVEGVVGAEAMLIAARERGVPAGTGGDPETASLVILRGPGRAAQGGAHPGAIDVEAGGRTATLDRPLLAVYVPRPGAAPIGPFVISRAGLLQVQALLYPSLAQRFGWAQPEVAPSAGPVWQPPPREERPLPPRAPGALPGDFPGGGSRDDGPPSGFVPALPNLNPPPPRPRPPSNPPQQPQRPTSTDVGSTGRDTAPPPPPPPPPPPQQTSSPNDSYTSSPSPQPSPAPSGKPPR